MVLELTQAYTIDGSNVGGMRGALFGNGQLGLRSPPSYSIDRLNLSSGMRGAPSTTRVNWVKKQPQAYSMDRANRGGMRVALSARVSRV